MFVAVVVADNDDTDAVVAAVADTDFLVLGYIFGFSSFVLLMGTVDITNR